MSTASSSPWSDSTTTRAKARLNAGRAALPAQYVLRALISRATRDAKTGSHMEG